jgi:hypothetical protein
MLTAAEVEDRLKQFISKVSGVSNSGFLTTLLSDDAPQFKQIASHHALCWIHDGRNYKKLRPIVPYHKEKLEAFLNRYWDFYGELCEFREDPSAVRNQQFQGICK